MMGDRGGLVGCRAALASRRLMPEPISSSHGTARLAPSISSLTSSRDRDAAAANVSVIRWARRKFKDGIGLVAFVGRTGIFLRTGSYAMATAEHREQTCVTSAGQSGRKDRSRPAVRHGAAACAAPSRLRHHMGARELLPYAPGGRTCCASRRAGKRASWQSS